MGLKLRAFSQQDRQVAEDQRGQFFGIIRLACLSQAFLSGWHA
jgi:hypothetical protein